MHRMQLGGFALALGLFASPAAGQTPAQPTRSARLGLPTAIPSGTTVDSGVTPAAGLMPRGQMPGNMVPSPMPQNYSVPAPSNTPSPMYQYPMGNVPMGNGPLGTAQPQPTMGATPSITEVRQPEGTVQIPGYQPGLNGVPNSGQPYIVPGTTVIVPGTTGGLPYAGVPFDGSTLPNAGMEVPIYGDCPPGFPAMERLQSCNRWWVNSEYMMLWTRSIQLPTLLTTSSPQYNGIPGQGDTRSVLSGDFGRTFHNGARLTFGRWFGDDQIRGAEARFLFVQKAESQFTTTSTDNPVLARPFFNVNQPYGPYSQLIASPGLSVGGAVVNLENELWGAEANYRRFLFGNACSRVDAIVGFRYLGIKEQLTISEGFIRTGTAPSGSVGSPAVYGTVTDSFRTENQFYGGQIGLNWEFKRGRWSVDSRATVAFGNLHQTSEISGGQNLLYANGTTANFAGGLLAVPGANIGTFTQSKFAVLPEVGVNVGYQLTSHLRMFVGYNFLYLGNTLRPNGTINPYIDAARIPNFPLPGNPGVLPGTPQPTPQFRLNDFFVQGITFGLQFSW